MRHWIPDFSIKKTILFSMLVGLSAFLVMAFIIHDYYKQKVQEEILQATESYMVFQTELENRIQTNIYLLNGYVAYLKTECEFDWDQSTEYLSALMEGQELYIHNISTILDTTIVSKFPLEGNESPIGIDLAMMETQKEMVLKTKNERVTTFQGPIPLLQGGYGFVVRVPVVRADSGYWGQVGIILSDEQIYGIMRELAEKTSLNVRVYNSQDHDNHPIYSFNNKEMKDPITFQFSPRLIDWKIEVVPMDGWCPIGLSHILIGVICVLISIGIGFLSYYSMKGNYKIKHNSIHDSLTGLMNRHFLKEYQYLIISAAKRKKAMVGLLLLDLDNFKNINDTYGHSIGDEVLIETARILRKTVRTNEAVFRIGGDEFLIIFPMIEDQLVLEKAGKRILEMLRDEFEVKNKEICIAASMGMGIYPIDGEDFEEVLLVADRKMYENKKQKTKK